MQALFPQSTRHVQPSRIGKHIRCSSWAAVTNVVHLYLRSAYLKLKLCSPKEDIPLLLNIAASGGHTAGSSSDNIAKKAYQKQAYLSTRTLHDMLVAHKY